MAHGYVHIVPKMSTQYQQCTLIQLNKHKSMYIAGGALFNHLLKGNSAAG